MVSIDGHVSPDETLSLENFVNSNGILILGYWTRASHRLSLYLRYTYVVNGVKVENTFDRDSVNEVVVKLLKKRFPHEVKKERKNMTSLAMVKCGIDIQTLFSIMIIHA